MCQCIHEFLGQFQTTEVKNHENTVANCTQTFEKSTNPPSVITRTFRSIKFLIAAIAPLMDSDSDGRADSDLHTEALASDARQPPASGRIRRPGVRPGVVRRWSIN